MRKLTVQQTDKLFSGHASDVYDKLIEDTISLYANLFPELCTSKTFSDMYYDLVRERMMVELQVLYSEAQGESETNLKSKYKKIKRAMAK